MACSKFEYTKSFEVDDALLPGVYIVVRIDGRGFTKFTSDHGYVKPNDIRGLSLMNHCAAAIMSDWGDIVMAFGESDEYSFVLPRNCNVYGRRSAKIATNIVSSFAANFVFHWSRYFGDTALRSPPAFDARCVCYPTLRSVVDYFKWRQVDTHINTLQNESFWSLVNLGGWGRCGKVLVHE
jgi:tRNA(His) guanylyltransferase